MIPPNDATRPVSRWQTAIQWLLARAVWIAIAVVTAEAIIALLQASALIDGIHYFWLDDDQMISMRYARNLSSGSGLVWNPGEAVEGYTNFLWTIVMAVIHMLPISDAKTAIAVELINWGLLCSLLALVNRLRRIFNVDDVSAGVLLLTLSLNLDLVYWAVHGFETTLVTTVFLLIAYRALSHPAATEPSRKTVCLLAVLLLTRSDSLYVWIAAAGISYAMAADRRRAARRLLSSLLPFALHLLWRRWYYGDWLPNTYYLRVEGIVDRAALAADYLTRFGRHYGLAFLVAFIGCVLSGDRRRWLLLAALVPGVAYVLLVGEDLFDHSRFLAFAVPGILLLAVCGISDVLSGRPRIVLLLSFAVATTWLVGVTSAESLRDDNGKPLVNAIAGVLIGKFTRPEASVAVLAAGNVPYFSRRVTIDMLGKSDRVIARSQPHPEGYVAHNKYDPEYSLRRHPDVVVSFWPHKWAIDEWTIEQAQRGGDAWITALISSPTFRREYLPNPVPIDALSDESSVYIWERSPERSRMDAWAEPSVSRAVGHGEDTKTITFR